MWVGYLKHIDHPLNFVLEIRPYKMQIEMGYFLKIEKFKHLMQKEINKKKIR